MLGTRREIPFSSFANELGSDGHPSKEMLDALTRAATTALTSQDATARREASDQLLFLSAFEYWELTKQIFPLCQDNYLRFMVCKAMNFVVRNELGPDDRRSMQFYILNYIQDRRKAGEVLPSFLRNSLFSVFASAMFGSWRMMAVTSEYPDGGAHVGEDDDCVYQPHKVVEMLSSFLVPSEVVECLLEIISYFGKQLQTTLLDNVKKRYGSSVLPCFFRTLVQLLPELPAAAVEVCCATLESVPDGFAGLIDLRRTTEKSVNLIAWERWREPLEGAMDFCANVVLQQPRGALSDACGRFMRLCSLVSCPEESFLTSRDSFSITLINFSERLFLLCAQDSSLSEMLELACVILVNVFERARDITVQYFCEKPDALPAWIDAATFFLCRYNDDEEELRRLLMSLFYYLAENLLPKRRDADLLNVALRGRPSASLNYAVDDESGFLVDPFGRSRTPYSAVGPLDDHYTQVLHDGVLRVFQTYFNTIMANSHLRKDSQELRSTTALKMNNEKMLFPLAELLFCERIDLLRVLTDRLRETKEQYAACVQLRQRLLTGGECGELEALARSVAEGLSGDELSQSQSRENTVFILTHMCLSRLSVIISIVAIALINAEVKDPDVLTTIAEFGEQLLTADDSVTIDLLQCLSLLDDDDTIANSAARGGGGGGEGTRLHLGILRAFFFFCSCTYESEFSRLPAFYEVTLNLLRFIYLHHSDVPCLMMDANILLHRMITKGISASNFLSSPKLSDIMEAVRDNRLVGLRPPLGRALTDEEKRARRFFYTTFTEVAETRYYLGYDNGNVPLVTLVHRLLSDEELNYEPNIALQDLAAVTNGCHQVDFFLTIVDGVLGKKDMLSALLRQSADCAHTLVYLFAKLS
ncbi:hypothetical protein STCU_08757 [Strigomonas culicis]|uniref:Exportin-7 n=1 Tax=Strigomonas culicis TaxID=28005 RepID=S9TRE9_9TRYP|nr:hypothetical protein STCU_08757 [Strigomonas culicis]|eukprot:EPY20962.1 hypothetical protein STCU_08757 [Strigomonas culicis]